MGARNDIIELEPVSDADGNITWAQIIEHIDAHENGVTTGREIVVRPGGTLDLVSAEQATGLSRLPQERMAGGDNDWDRIISTIQAKEAGHTTGTEPPWDPWRLLTLETRMESCHMRCRLESRRRVATARLRRIERCGRCVSSARSWAPITGR